VNTNRLIPLMLGASLFAGCDKKPEIHAYDAPKDPPPGNVQLASQNAPKKGGDHDHEHKHDGPLTWKAPADWKEIEKAPMSEATFLASADPRIVCTISKAGGGAIANINRWEGQLGLPPATTPETLDKIATVIERKDGEQALLVDLKGPPSTAADKPQQRMLAAMVRGDEVMWFFKMTGPIDKITALQPAFEGLVKSSTFHGDDDHAKPAAPAPAAAAAKPAADAPKAGADANAAAIPGIAAYTLPKGWQVDPKPRQMRIATLLVGSAENQAELAVSKFPAAAMADMLGNLNRWRGQVGLGPTNDPNAHPPQEVAFPQGPGVILTFDGPEAQGAARKRLYVAMTKFPKGDQIWFFRLLGPYETVTAAKPALDEFVKSVKFEEK
jgi:hypothetical protein